MRARLILLIIQLVFILVLGVNFIGETKIIAQVSSSPVLQNIQLNPTDSYFTSPSTNQGKRRFLAIGDFFDTTNSAYFQSSVSYLTFQFPLNQDMLLKQVKFSVRKYASSAIGNTPITLLITNSGNGSQLEFPPVHADNGDYDYDLLAWDLTDYLKGISINTTDLQLHFKLWVNNPQYKQGIAICSGNSTDAVCPEEMFPQLILSYYSNTKGSLISSQIPQLQSYNAISKAENYKCKVRKGCDFDLAISYQDLELNASLKVVIFDQFKKTELQQLNLNLTAGTDHFALNLPDGDYSWTLTIIDGSYRTFIPTSDFRIDTIPPDSVVILYHSAFGTRAGVHFIIEQFSEAVLTVNLINDTNEVLTTREFTIPIFQFKSELPLTNNEEYYYQLYLTDLAGNRSADLKIAILQQNDYLIPLSVNSNFITISPANQDGNFDLLEVEYQYPEEISNLQIQIWDKTVKKIFSQSLATIQNTKMVIVPFNGRDLEKYLPDGVYYLSVTAQDKYGYPVVEDRLIQFKIDNTGPELRGISSIR